MKLSNKILYIQKWADKTLSFGCLCINSKEVSIYIRDKSDFSTTLLYDGKLISYEDDIGVIGHPMTRGRLCYLHKRHKDNRTFEHLQRREDLLGAVSDNGELYTQTVLDWNEDFLDLVIEFLSTLPKE